MSDTPTKKTVENLELIAVRVPPGDKWKLVDDDKNVVHPSLTDALETYFGTTRFSGDFRMSPKAGNLFAIKVEEEVVPPKPVRKFNIYGDGE